MHINDKHFSLTSSQDIKQLISPLEKLGISFFTRLRLYSDGCFTILTSHAEHHKYFINREMSGSFSLQDVKTGIYLWDDIIDPKIVTESRNYFDLDNLISFTYADKDYADSFSFGSSAKKSSMLSFYFNNLDLLQNFIEYFKSVSDDLFKRSDKERIIFPAHMMQRTNNNLIDASPQNGRTNLLSSIGAIKKIHKLTEKELVCLKYLAQGKSVKEVAFELENSPRTIETHLTNIKMKTGCASKAQALDIYFKQSSVAHYIDLSRDKKH